MELPRWSTFPVRYLDYFCDVIKERRWLAGFCNLFVPHRILLWNQAIKNPLPYYRANRASAGFLATLFNVGCNSHKSAHDPEIVLWFQGGLLSLKQENLSQRRGLSPFVILTSWLPAGWLGTLRSRLPGGHRASSLPPLFMLIPDCLIIKPYILGVVNKDGLRQQESLNIRAPPTYLRTMQT